MFLWLPVLYLMGEEVFKFLNSKTVLVSLSVSKRTGSEIKLSVSW